MTEELRRRGVPSRQRLRVVVESIKGEEPGVMAMNAAGGRLTGLRKSPISIATPTSSSCFADDGHSLWGDRSH